MHTVHTCTQYTRAHSTHVHTVHTCTQYTHAHSTHVHTVHTCRQYTHAHSTHMHTVHTCTQHTHAEYTSAHKTHTHTVLIYYIEHTPYEALNRWLYVLFEWARESIDCEHHMRPTLLCQRDSWERTVCWKYTPVYALCLFASLCCLCLLQTVYIHCIQLPRAHSYYVYFRLFIFIAYGCLYHRM